MKKRKKENNLGKDDITNLLIKLAIPSMLAQFVNVLYNLVDRIFISRIPEIGDLALAGVGISAPIIALITSFCYLVALGGAPLVAMRLGEDNKEKAQSTMSNCFILLLAISIIVTIVCLIIKEPMLRLFGSSVNTFQYANEYLTIYLFGTTFAIMSLGLNSFISCQGFSKVAMFSVILGAVTNIILDPIFIFTLELGVAGGALATVIAQALSCVFVVSFLLGKRTIVKLSLHGFKSKTIKKILTLGISPFLIMATEALIIIALNSVLNKYGGINSDNYIAAGTIIICFMQLITFPLGGITTGAQPIMSYNFGAGNFDRIKKAIKGLLLMCLIFTVSMFAIARTIPNLFVLIFTTNPITVDIAIRGIKIYTLGTIFLTTQYALVDTLTALGQAKHAVFLSMIRKIGILFVLTLILPIIWGVESTFYAEPIADIFGGILSVIVFSFSIGKIFEKRKHNPFR